MNSLGSLQSHVGLNATNFFIAEVVNVVIPYLNDYLKQMGWSYESIGYATSMIGLGTFLVQTPAGIFIDRSCQRRLLLGVSSLVVGICCVLLPYLVDSPILVNIALFVTGAASTFFGPLLGVLAFSLVGQKAFGPTIGINQGWSHFGNVVTVIFISYCVQHFGVASAFHTIGIVSVVTCLCLFLIKKDELVHSGKSDAPESQIRQFLKLVRNRDIQVLLGSTALLFVANAGTLPLVALRIRELGGTDNQLAFVVIIAQLIMIPAAWGAGVIKMGRKPLYGTAFFLLPLRIFLYSVTENVNVILAIQALDGVIMGIYGIVIALICSDITKGKNTFNSLMGMTATALALGTVIGPVIQGILTHHLGFVNTFRVLATVALAAAILFFTKMPETREA